jgi:hypothetical protein
MKLHILMVLVALVIPEPEYAQTQINKSIPVQAGQTIVMHFDYPELVRVTTWDKNEVEVKGTVNINNGENDDAFQLETSNTGGTVNIRSQIKDMKNLPQRITVVRGGQKMIFRDKEALKKYEQEHGKGHDVMSYGSDIDIQLEIKVPRNMTTRVESVYGMVEVQGFSGPLTVEATYGGVDASVSEKATGEIIAQTNYGEIYTNLDTKFGGDKTDKDFHTYVSAKPGTGPKYNFESKYGNVYIRKAAN